MPYKYCIIFPRANIQLDLEATWKKDGMWAVVRAAQKKAADIKPAADTRIDTAATAKTVATAAEAVA